MSSARASSGFALRGFLLAAVLMSPAAAIAGPGVRPTITSVYRVVQTRLDDDTVVDTRESQSAGRWMETASGQYVAPDGATTMATAMQDGTAAASHIRCDGSAHLTRDGGESLSGIAISSMQVSFTCDEVVSYVIHGSVSSNGSGGGGQPNASVNIEMFMVGSDAEFSFGTVGGGLVPVDASGSLQPGSYRLIASATVGAGFELESDLLASFSFTMGFGGAAGDFDGDGAVGVPDIFSFLSAWFAQDPRADFDGSGAVEVSDIFEFLSTWFAGTP